MSKLWADLKENMKDWSTSAVEKAEEVSRLAMAKTEEMTRISKIKFETAIFPCQASSSLLFGILLSQGLTVKSKPSCLIIIVTSCKVTEQ